MIIRSREVARITAAVLVSMLCGACGTGQRDAAAEPPQEATSAASAAPQQVSRSSTPDGPAVLPWVSAIVARDDTSITVATGIASVVCGEPTRPKATITYQDDTQVVISVTSSISRAEELCAKDGSAAPAFVSLQKPLGDRVLRDAATTRLHPTYFERDVPDLLADKRWDPSGRDLGPGESRARPTAVVATGPPPGGWFQHFRDPDGAMLSLDARPTARVHRPATIATVPIGSRQGIITTYGAPGSPWTVWWEAGQVTYSLSLIPPESHGFTLKQFKQQLAGFTWS